MKQTTLLLVMAAALLSAAPVLAASDYLLEIEGVPGESATAAPMAVDSWSFGVCNSGQCSTVVSPRDSATGLATGKAGGKGRPSTSTYDLATNKGARTAGGGEAVVVGDLDGDGAADLAFVKTQSEVTGFTLTFQSMSAANRKVCAGMHIKDAHLRGAADTFELSDADVSCTVYPDTPANRYMLGLRGTALRGGKAPLPAPGPAGGADAKQTQGASFGERCANGACDTMTDGLLVMRFSGGQMKHTKTGHVTLMK